MKQKSFLKTIAVVFVVFSLTLASVPVVAQNQASWADAMYDDLSPMVDRYNEKVEPSDFGFAASQLSGETVNLVVTDTDGSQATASFKMDDQMKIRDVAQGERSDATLKMSTDRATMERVTEADDPSEAFLDAILRDRISIDGIGLSHSAVWIVLNFAVDIAILLGFF